MSRVVVIHLHALASGLMPTCFDDTYVVEYDPTRPGVDPVTGAAMNAHLVTTPDPHKALKLDFVEAWELWRKEHGMRDDGMPNRPLTAFHVSFDNAPMEGS